MTLPSESSGLSAKVNGHYQAEQPSVVPKPVEYIQQTRDRYDSLGYPPYQWFQAEEVPKLAQMSKSLSDAKLGLVSTGGTYVKGQKAFYYKDDASIRQISSQTDPEDLRFSHIMENYLVEAWQDPGVLFPIEQLRSMEQDGLIGSLADNFISCMGGIYSQRKVISELIPKIEAVVDKQKLDLLFLVPL